VYNIKNVLNAYNYESICHFSVIPPYGKYVTPDLLARNATIFCKTDFIDYLFDQIKHSNNEYILVTHHSDYPIDAERWNKKPSCIKKWYAINPTVVHTDLIALPLGVKTHADPYYEPQYMTNWFAENINTLRSIPKIGNIYCNWNNTNISRNNIISTLKDKEIKFTHDTNVPFNEYITKMSQHKFVISPPGNGIDCHRTWEALYVGCIPIVIKNYIYNDWKLPIIQVDDFNDLTQELLDNYHLPSDGSDMLSINYWNNIINRYER